VNHAGAQLIRACIAYTTQVSPGFGNPQPETGPGSASCPSVGQFVPDVETPNGL
jgi:hypothetical protein